MGCVVIPRIRRAFFMTMDIYADESGMHSGSLGAVWLRERVSEVTDFVLEAVMNFEPSQVFCWVGWPRVVRRVSKDGEGWQGICVRT